MNSKSQSVTVRVSVCNVKLSSIIARVVSDLSVPGSCCKDVGQSHLFTVGPSLVWSNWMKIGT